MFGGAFNRGATNAPRPPTAPPAPPQAKPRPRGNSLTPQEDLSRILAVPFLPLDQPRCTDQGYHQALLHPMRPDGWSLRQVQLDAVWEYEHVGGLLAPIGVGWGKGLISLLCAKIAHTRRGHRTVALCVPPELIEATQDRVLPEARKTVRLDDTPFYFVVGTAAQRMKVASSGMPGVYVISYSTFSTESGFETLQKIGATAWILDEAHRLSNDRTARTKRWTTAVREIEGKLPEGHIGIDVVPMSGTLTKKSVRDYAHLAKAALRESSPVPISPHGIEEWSNAIDADKYASNLSAPLMRQQIEWALTNGLKLNPQGLTVREIAREAYQYRLRSAPGVVATSDQSVDCSLVIRWLEPKFPKTPDGDKVIALMKKVVQEDVTPDGDEIDWAFHRFKWLWELSSGFYNSLQWPEPEDLMKKGYTLIQADNLIEQARYHHTLLQLYHKHLRTFLKGKHVPGCDTPLLVGSWIKRICGGAENVPKIPPEMIEAWKAAHEADYDNLPKRISRPVRICDYRIKAAVEWAKAHPEGGLMWHHHPEVGMWVHEALQAEGIAHTYAPAGENEKAFAKGLVVISYAHGTGKNLQHHDHNLFIELRREAATMEQTLGRTHRQGQMADEVYADLLIVNGFDLAMFNACLADADYAQSSTGQRQKLCYAAYSPVIPPTNPRLFVKLGILENMPSSVRVESFEQITDDAVAAEVFRPAAYHTGKKI